MRNPRPELCRIAREVAARGTTVAAAEALNMTQATVSKALARLESDLGADLFVRVRGRLRVAEQNRPLFESVLQTAAAWERLADAADAMRVGAESPLRIISTPSIGQNLIARAIERLVARNPACRVDLRFGDPLHEVSRGDVELGLMFSPEAGPELHVERLARGRMIVVMRPDDPDAGKPMLTAGDIARRRLICFDRTRSPLGRLISEHFDVQGVVYRPFIEVPYCITAAHLVAAGCGIAVVDEFSAADEVLDRLVKLPLEPRIDIDISLITRESAPLSMYAQIFTRLLREAEALAFE